MRPFRSGAASKRDKGSVRDAGGDVIRLVVDYVKQETLHPLKGLGRFLVFGIAGSLALCIGVVLLLVALLRALQTETGTTFTGDLSWLPYAIVAVAAVIVAAAAAWRITKGPARRRRAAGADDGGA